MRLTICILVLIVLSSCAKIDSHPSAAGDGQNIVRTYPNQSLSTHENGGESDSDAPGNPDAPSVPVFTPAKGVLDTSFNALGTKPGTVSLSPSAPELMLFGWSQAETATLFFQPRSFKLLANGSVVVLLSFWETTKASGGFVLRRVLADGTIDSSFGLAPTSGLVLMKGQYHAQALLVHPDNGNLIVFANKSDANGNDIAGQLTKFEIAANGESSSNLSILYPPAPFTLAAARSFQVTDDGKFLLAGSAIGPGSSSYGVVVAKYLSNGTPDGASIVRLPGVDGPTITSFEKRSGGFAAAGFAQISNQGTATPLIVYYRPDGTLDTTFVGSVPGARYGTSWQCSAGLQDYSLTRAIASTPSGGLAVAGSHTYFQNLVGLLDATGSLVAGFKPQGGCLAGTNNGATPLGGPNEAIAAQPDGNILVAGSSMRTAQGGSYLSAFIMRLTADGEPDPTLGAGVLPGVSFLDELALPYIQSSGRVTAMALRPTGEILIFGNTYRANRWEPQLLGVK